MYQNAKAIGEDTVRLDQTTNTVSFALETAVNARYDHLKSVDQKVLKAASVIGNPVGLHIVAPTTIQSYEAFFSNKMRKQI